MLGEVALKDVKKGEIIQLQRKGFFICDVPYAPHSSYSSRERPLILFHIPDGHMSASTTASPKVLCNFYFWYKFNINKWYKYKLVSYYL
jgi:bifunctional glutamyl/prolyl-tRNA synthetase